jgi:hypothetical protein
MVVNGTMLASELRRRRVHSHSLIRAVDTVDRSTSVIGDLRTTPTSYLVLAAMSLASAAGRPWS